MRYNLNSFLIFYEFKLFSNLALHVAPQVKKFVNCNYFILRTYWREYEKSGMADVYKDLLARGQRVLLYNGDLDLACNFLGNQWFVKDLKAPLKQDKRPWYITVGYSVFHA